MNCKHDWKLDPANDVETSRTCQKCGKREVWQWLKNKRCYGWPEE